MNRPKPGLISELFETHLNVADLERSMKFYEEVLGLEQGFTAAVDKARQAPLESWPTQVDPPTSPSKISLELLRIKNHDFPQNVFVKFA